MHEVITRRDPTLYAVTEGPLFKQVMVAQRYRAPTPVSLFERVCTDAKGRLERLAISDGQPEEGFLRVLDYEVLQELAEREGHSYELLRNIAISLSGNQLSFLRLDFGMVPAMLGDAAMGNRIINRDHGLTRNGLGWRWAMEVPIQEGYLPDPEELYESIREEFPPETLSLDGSYSPKIVLRGLQAMYRHFPTEQAVASVPLVKSPKQDLEGWVHGLLAEFIEQLEDEGAFDDDSDDTEDFGATEWKPDEDFEEGDWNSDGGVL